MKINLIWMVVCGLFLQSNAFGQLQEFDQVAWTTKEVAKGIVWKHAHAKALLGVAQNINVLEIDTRKRDVTLVYDKDKNRPTSELSREAKALASVNAGFFDMKNGGSTAYIKVDGAVPDTDTLKWKKHPRYSGTIIINTRGKIAIEERGNYRSYTDNRKYDDVLVTGNLLMDNGARVKLKDDAFVTTRHPRTCLGMISKHKLVLVTVDGRSEQSAGMDLHELTDLMISLGCSEAINLDGGGSTTMWLADSGVVNMPSDNKKFDHEGERPVSNIIVVR
jgi:exopolysaccharide biosynthesis protein